MHMYMYMHTATLVSPCAMKGLGVLLRLVTGTDIGSFLVLALGFGTRYGASPTCLFGSMVGIDGGARAVAADPARSAGATASGRAIDIAFFGIDSKPDAEDTDG